MSKNRLVSSELFFNFKNNLLQNGNFIKNLKDLDMKARELIDKSEFTLSEKAVSSEGRFIKYNNIDIKWRVIIQS